MWLKSPYIFVLRHEFPWRLILGVSALKLTPCSDWLNVLNQASLTLKEEKSENLCHSTALSTPSPSWKGNTGMDVSGMCRNKFISVGYNRTPNAADWSCVSQRIAFGAYNAVALWEPEVPSDSLVLLGMVGLTGRMRDARESRRR